MPPPNRTVVSLWFSQGCVERGTSRRSGVSSVSMTRTIALTGRKGKRGNLNWGQFSFANVLYQRIVKTCILGHSNTELDATLDGKRSEGGHNLACFQNDLLLLALGLCPNNKARRCQIDPSGTNLNWGG